MGGVGVQSFRLWLCFFFTFFFICHARPLISFSGNDLRPEGRSLMATLDDYSDPSANHGHDPRTRIVGGGNGKKKSRVSRCPVTLSSLLLLLLLLHNTDMIC